MKRFVKIYTYWLLGILLFTGCDDYLKEDSGEFSSTVYYFEKPLG
mgnify:CR=1 FL=1